jgi:hypothetical protein
VVRSRAQELDSVDRPLSFFLQMERKRGKNKFIHSLVNNDKQILTDHNSIIAFTEKFYQNLLTQKPINKSTWDVLLQGIPVLATEEAHICESPITMEECVTAINQMADNKSLGCELVTDYLLSSIKSFLTSSVKVSSASSIIN